MSFNYVFGPVYSSRLGRSLGIDLLGEKICSFDCLYCEVGKTKEKTLERKPYVLAEQVLREVEVWFAQNTFLPDVITLGGSGEPCLNVQLGEIAKSLKQKYDLPLALLTNSSLLFLPEVLKEIEVFDLILPSLDSCVEKEFQKINRPVKDITLKEIKAGLLALSKHFKGQIFLEVLLLPKINNSRENLKALQDFISQLNLARVDVTTMTRPGAYLFQRVSSEEIKYWQKNLRVNFNKEDTKPKADFHIFPKREIDESSVLASLKRRPQRVEDMAEALGVEKARLEDMLYKLLQEKKVMQIRDEKEIYYQINEGKNEKKNVY